MFTVEKRMHIITGHYGSGKTTLAVNMALDAVNRGKNVTLVDLDIVNPYFRAADHRRLLENNGVRVIAPSFANTNLDIPALPDEIYSIFNKQTTVFLDVGGDDAGAYVLGRFSQRILSENQFVHYYVVNQRRILTQTAEEAVGILREIEKSSRIPVTALINNTHLGEDTTSGIIEESEQYVEKIAELSGVPVVFTACKAELAAGKRYPIMLYAKNAWDFDERV